MKKRTIALRRVSLVLAVSMLLSVTAIADGYSPKDDSSFNPQTLVEDDPAASGELIMPQAAVYEKIVLPGDGEFHKITNDFEMPAKSRVSFQGTWTPSYARLEFRLYAHSTGNGAYVMLNSGRSGGLNASAASVYSLYARSVDGVDVRGSINITN